MRAPRFIVRDRALFEHLRNKGYRILEAGVFAAIPDEELRADISEFASLRRRSLRRDVRDDSRRLRQGDELAEQERQRESSDVTVSSLDDLATALTGGQ